MKRHAKGLLESRLCMKYKSSILQALKFFHFEFINQLSMFSMFYICEGGVKVWLQVDRLSFVYMFVLHPHLMPLSSLHPWITHANYGASETPTRLQISVFFLHPPPHCLLSIWSLSMLKHLACHPITIFQKICWRGNTRLLTMLSLKSILQALQNKVNAMNQRRKNKSQSGN